MPSVGNGFEALAYMNFFRILADLTHAASKGILIYAIHRNRSAEGASSSLPLQSTRQSLTHL